MKNLHLYKIFILVLLAFSLTSCEVVEAIFKTGLGIGIFITVSALVLILVVVGIIRGRSK
jgi:hypothetical protein